MTEKYRGEFGSSPCLLDDAIADPELAARLEAGIPELKTRPANERRYLGDLCKIDGVVHVWMNGKWRSLAEVNGFNFTVET